MASISIRKSDPYNFDTSTNVTAGAAGGVTVPKTTIAGLAIGQKIAYVANEDSQFNEIARIAADRLQGRT